MATTSVVTNLGRACLVNRAGGSNGTFGSPPFSINLGTGTGIAIASMTALYTELGSARLAATASQLTTSSTNDTVQFVATYTASATVTITNCGLFDKATAGSLLAATSFTGITLVSGDVFVAQFQIQFV
jgi:hypothetical protein